MALKHIRMSVHKRVSIIGYDVRNDINNENVVRSVIKHMKMSKVKVWDIPMRIFVTFNEDEDPYK